MSDPIRLTFTSELRAPASEVWAWITSVAGISSELRPFFRMSAPAGVRTLDDVEFRPGRVLFRSRVFLFGVLPVDHSDLTLVELVPGVGFVEQSPMGSMRLWRHERRIGRVSGGVVLTDRLTFDPRHARPFVAWFIGRVFRHRHRVLRARFGGGPPARDTVAP